MKYKIEKRQVISLGMINYLQNTPNSWAISHPYKGKVWIAFVT